MDPWQRRRTNGQISDTTNRIDICQDKIIRLKKQLEETENQHICLTKQLVELESQIELDKRLQDAELAGNPEAILQEIDGLDKVDDPELKKEAEAFRNQYLQATVFMVESSKILQLLRGRVATKLRETHGEGPARQRARVKEPGQETALVAGAARPDPTPMDQGDNKKEK